MDSDSPAEPEMPSVPETDSAVSGASVLLTKRERSRLRVLSKRHGLLRSDIERALQSGMPLEREAFHRLLDVLRDRSTFRFREQMSLAWVLSILPLDPQQRFSSSMTLSETLHRHTWFDLATRILYNILGGIALCGLTGFLCAFQESTAKAVEIMIACSMASLCPSVVLLWPLTAIFEDTRINRLRAQAVETLGKLGLPESCGVVAEAVYDSAGGRATAGRLQVRRAAVKALPELLAGLTPEHYGHMEAALISRLCDILSHGNEYLVLAALTALGKVGDGRAVAPVERLVKRGRSHFLRSRAEAILPTLIERRNREQAPQMLLRASAPTLSGETLLRAASGVPDAAPEELLRAATEEYPGG